MKKPLAEGNKVVNPLAKSSAEVARLFIDTAREKFCVPCVAEGRNPDDVDLENIMRSRCRCRPVNNLLESAKGLLDPYAPCQTMPLS